MKESPLSIDSLKESKQKQQYRIDIEDWDINDDQFPTVNNYHFDTYIPDPCDLESYEEEDIKNFTELFPRTKDSASICGGSSLVDSKDMT